uniref:Uncharacterized protein n=1 Tax=Aegilops tauschii subsp. strangulata TaxID=200361 RepID=A0A453F1B4_AEGTS
MAPEILVKILYFQSFGPVLNCVLNSTLHTLFLEFQTSVKLRFKLKILDIYSVIVFLPVQCRIAP